MVRHLEPELEELHQTEGRLQAVIQSAPVAILEVDLSSRVIRWNPAAEQIFGWTRDEILGSPVPIVPPSKQAEFEDVLATVRSGRRYPNVETYRQRKDGSLVDVELAAAPVRDSSGKVVSHMVVFTESPSASVRSASCAPHARGSCGRRRGATPPRAQPPRWCAAAPGGERTAAPAGGRGARRGSGRRPPCPRGEPR